MSEHSPVTEPIVLSLFATDLLDPPSELTELRQTQPMCRVRYTDGEVGWLVTSHALAKKVLADLRFGHDAPGARLHGGFGDPGWLAELSDARDALGYRPMRGFIEMNPPDHTRYRRLLAPQFTARRIEEFRPRVEQIVADRLDALALETPPVDLVSAYTTHVSLLTQCAFLGVPDSDAGYFYRLGSTMFNPDTTGMDVVVAWREAYEFVRGIVADKRSHPTDDVISIIATQAELTDDEVADTALVLFQGGLETTGDMMALGVFALLCQRDQYDLLRADLRLVGPAVEELLRYCGIFRFLFRTALQDVDLDGHLIHAGESVTVSPAVANRDPNAFEDPDQLMLGRPTTGHLAFGQGIHMCIGQHLARLELQVGLGGLVARFPSLDLAVAPSDIPVYSPTQPIFGVFNLPVGW